MAWIESHQQLRDHPKVTRLGRLLDVHRTSAVGLLHFLWWWALDHAEDGDLTDFDPLDLAVAAGWDGDPDRFLTALLECGPGGRCGFLAYDGDRLVLHDWWDYAGKLVDRRQKDRDRKKAQREASDRRPPEVRGTSSGSPTVQNSTEPNPTKNKNVAPPKATRKPDLIFDALVNVCGLNPGELTKSGRGALNRATAELRDIGATPEGITARAKVHRQRWPGAELTPSSLAKNYAQLGVDPSRKIRAVPSPDACGKCGQPLLEHDVELCAILERAG
jgi:hypothetical protein